MSWDCDRFKYLNTEVIPHFVRNVPPYSYLTRTYMAKEGGIFSSVLKTTSARVDAIAAAKHFDEQYIGIEVELENCANNGIVPDEVFELFCFYWSRHEDGSLRNGGKEFVTNLGVSVDTAYDALTSLEQYIKIATNGQAQANARTGLHVHFNVGGRSLRQLSNILFLYAVLEPAFFEVSGKRDENIFCVPWHANRQSLGNVINNLVNMCESKHYSKIWKWRNYSKYCALNIAPVSSFGTIEFRMHEGTYDPDAIYRWVKTIDRLFQYADKTDISDNYQWLRSRRTFEKYSELLRHIFPEYMFLNKREVIEKCIEATIATLKGFVDYGHLPEQVKGLAWNGRKLGDRGQRHEEILEEPFNPRAAGRPMGGLVYGEIGGVQLGDAVLAGRFQAAAPEDWGNGDFDQPNDPPDPPMYDDFDEDEEHI